VGAQREGGRTCLRDQGELASKSVKKVRLLTLHNEPLNSASEGLKSGTSSWAVVGRRGP